MTPSEPLEHPIVAEVDIQVQFFDLDPMNIVWHGNYVNYLEVARCKLLDSIEYNYEQMKASGYAWPVIDLHARYIKPAVFGQMIRVRAELLEWENRLKIGYLITDAANGQRLLKAATTQVAVDMAHQEMCFASPVILAQKLARYRESASGASDRREGSGSANHATRCEPSCEKHRSRLEMED